MIDWYVDLDEGRPYNLKNDRYLQSVIETATPFMNYFVKRLNQMENWTVDDANKIFSSIIEEMPIMKPRIWKDEFYIEYNRYTRIKLTDTTKQIYRGIKLEKLLN
jgi:hypothetical protein